MPETLRVLVADDDATSRLILERTLRKRGYEVVVAKDGKEALSYLNGDHPPRIALLDWMMPILRGPDLCQKVRQRSDGDEQYIYLVLLTSKGEKEEVIAGLEAGADDYVTKPFNADELELRIRAGRRIIELQDQLVDAKHELRIQAEHDPLTGILNRGALLARIEAELARAKREKSLVGLAMLDLDHFKSINDTYGHQAGDEVLQETVARIQAVLRPYDTFGRYGGEEFVVAITDDKPSLAPFERVREAVAEREYEVRHHAIAVTLSVGVFWAGAETPLDVFLGRADASLYRAKANGRNRVELGDQKELIRS